MSAHLVVSVHLVMSAHLVVSAHLVASAHMQGTFTDTVKLLLAALGG